MVEPSFVFKAVRPRICHLNHYNITAPKYLLVKTIVKFVVKRAGSNEQCQNVTLHDNNCLVWSDRGDRGV